MIAPKLSVQAFKRLAEVFEGESGIHLSANKTHLMLTRLMPRLRALELDDFDAYCALLERHDTREERQLFVDRMTTNETYFFREPQQFDFLAQHFRTLPGPPPLRIWSAACSSGEEAYSVAMLLATTRPQHRDVVMASDLAQHVLKRAARAVYPHARLQHVPPAMLRLFLLRGKGAYANTVRVARPIRERVTFFRHNLLETGPALGTFDIILLRNALIYFDVQKKQQILERVVERLKPGGLLLVGLSESLHGHTLPVSVVGRSTYRRLNA